MNKIIIRSQDACGVSINQLEINAVPRGTLTMNHNYFVENESPFAYFKAYEDENFGSVIEFTIYDSNRVIINPNSESWINYKLLLRKYINYVKNSNGNDFIKNGIDDRQSGEFSDTEKIMLKEISENSNIIKGLNTTQL